MAFEKMMEIILVYPRFFAHEGGQVALKLFLKKLLGIFYLSNEIYIYKKDLKGHISRFNARKRYEGLNFSVHELNSNDVHRLSKETYQTPTDLTKRFTLEKRCFIVQDSGQICAYAWISLKEESVPDVQCMFTVPKDSFYIYNVRTKKEYRKQGIFSLLVADIEERLVSEGFTTAYVTILKDNTASIRSFKRAGYKEIGEVGLHRKCRRQSHSISSQLEMINLVHN